MGEEGGRPGAGTRHATQPPTGAAAGGRASTVVTCAGLSQGVLVDGSNTGLGGDQDNGESSDVAQQHGTTLGTASTIFRSLRYDMQNGANSNSQLGPVDTKIELKAGTQSRQDKGESDTYTIALNFRNHNLYL